MSKLHQKNVERQMIEIVNNKNNDNKCGDCGSSYPTWASYNLGIFLCGRCASVHRRVLPSNVSKVKSLTLDDWNSEQIDRLRRIGNKKARSKWNAKRVPFPYDDDNKSEIEQYIKDKYIAGKFRDEPMGSNDYDDGYESDEGRFGGSLARGLKLRSRSRLTSVRSVPSLTHRRLTTFESSQFTKQARQLANMGFSDLDLVKEALILANGDIDFALEILDKDSRVNPNQEETAPSLPRRPTNAAASVTTGQGFQDNNPMAALAQQQTSAGSEWWSGNAAMAAAPTGQPQIYQYTDPITGQISYVDSNGQEYLDPNNPQHQQLLMQQQNPQLIAQQTNKQQILSLYNQPENFTSNVAVPVDKMNQQPQQQQQQQPSQQLQQQQQQQQFQQPFQTGQPQFQQFGSQPPQQFQQQPLMQQQTAMGFQQPYTQQPYGQQPQQPYWQ